jgi:predicted double-glycine peptidase
VEAANGDLVSVPGKAGSQLEDLIGHAMAMGREVLTRLVRAALDRLVSKTGGELGVIHAGELLDDREKTELADALAAAIGTAQLLGRAQVRKRLADVLERRASPTNAGAVTEAVLDVPAWRQETPYSCGAAALASVLCYFDQGGFDESELAAELGTNPDDGTPPDAILRVAQARGLEADGKGGLTLGDLAAALDAGCPVLCPIQAYGTDAEAKQLQTGHWVVVIGYDEDNLYLQDPVAGLVGLAPGDFDRAWYDQDADGTICDHYGIVLGKGCKDAQEVRSEEANGLAGSTGDDRRDNSGSGRAGGHVCRHDAGLGDSLLRAVALREQQDRLSPMPPQRAVEYFTGLVPTLGTDPQRFGDDLRRRAFTLAVATDQELLGRVQDLVGERLRTGQGVGPGGRDVQQLLDDAGVSTSNPQYAEAVFRTNTHDAYHQGGTEAMQDPDVRDTFPVWQYSNPHDSRSRKTHAERNGKYYPSSVPFVQVRGTDAGDAINCRCDQIPIDKWTWAKRRGSGARVAEGYPDVPANVSTPTPPPTPVPARAPTPAAGPAPFQPGPNLDNAEGWLRQALPQIKPKLALLDVQAVNPTVQQLDRLARVFPEVAGRLRQLGGAPSRQAYAAATRDGTAILLNPEWYGQSAKLRQSLALGEETGWTPPGCNSIEYLMTHEFGHQVDNWIQQKLTGADRRAYEDFRDRLFAEAKAGRICGYAKASHEESFAESFAMLHHSPAEKLTATMQELLEWVDKARRSTGRKDDDDDDFILLSP